MGLIADVGSGPVALDSAPFIYFIEAHAIHLPLVEPLFTEAAVERLSFHPLSTRSPPDWDDR
ncbi:MAG: hypothetical protein KF911_03015 [Pseudomonadales bacterium]|nr:hypothetical protein [Pseudomonadales bacterium]